MQSLKILVVYPSFYQEASNTSEVFKNLIPILKKKVRTKIVWVNYQPEKIKKFPNDNTVINLDLRNYNDAIELLRKEKPDFVYVNPNGSFIDISLICASHSLDIPTVCVMYYYSGVGLKDSTRRFSLFSSYLKRFLSATVPSESKKNKTFLRSGKFILYKFQFLLKTIKKTDYRFLQKVSLILLILQNTFSPSKKIDRRLLISLFLVQNKTIEKYWLSNGVNSNSVKLTGNPMYDQIYNSLKNKRIRPRQEKIQILLLPIALEDTIWTKENATKILSDIITTVTSKNDKFSLTVKFHPTYTMFEYENLIHSINPEVKVYKKGHVTDYFNDIDVVIIYTSFSTAAMYALLENIPIILYNPSELKNDPFLKEGLALECKGTSTLLKKIETSLNFNIANQKKIEEYIKSYLYSFDGKSSERVCQALLEFKKYEN